MAHRCAAAHRSKVAVLYLLILYICKTIRDSAFRQKICIILHHQIKPIKKNIKACILGHKLTSKFKRLVLMQIRFHTFKFCCKNKLDLSSACPFMMEKHLFSLLNIKWILLLWNFIGYFMTILCIQKKLLLKLYSSFDS